MTGIQEWDWDFLLHSLSEGRCTAFVGPGVSAGVFPLGTEIAREWARQYRYPLDDVFNLAEVAEFLSVQYGRRFPRELAERIYGAIREPEFSLPDEPHVQLAELPIPIYITTKFDDLKKLVKQIHEEWLAKKKEKPAKAGGRREKNSSDAEESSRVMAAGIDAKSDPIVSLGAVATGV
jgi:hypothetical protein